MAFSPEVAALSGEISELLQKLDALCQAQGYFLSLQRENEIFRNGKSVFWFEKLSVCANNNSVDSITLLENGYMPVAKYDDSCSDLFQEARLLSQKNGKQKK